MTIILQTQKMKIKPRNIPVRDHIAAFNVLTHYTKLQEVGKLV